MTRIAAATLAGNARFPVCGFLVEGTERAACFGNGCPGFISSREVGDDAAGRNRHLTLVSGVTLRHAETAGLLRCGGRIGRRLRLPFMRHQTQAEADTEQGEEKRTIQPRHF